MGNGDINHFRVMVKLHFFVTPITQHNQRCQPPVLASVLIRERVRLLTLEVRMFYTHLTRAATLVVYIMMHLHMDQYEIIYNFLNGIAASVLIFISVASYQLICEVSVVKKTPNYLL